VSDFKSDISAALLSDGPIPKEKVLGWIAAVADSDLSSLAKLYQLTNKGYHRIQPELGMEPTCVLIQRYLSRHSGSHKVVPDKDGKVQTLLRQVSDRFWLNIVNSKRIRKRLMQSKRTWVVRLPNPQKRR
jgi:hypothetical protein